MMCDFGENLQDRSVFLGVVGDGSKGVFSCTIELKGLKSMTARLNSMSLDLSTLTGCKMCH